jgi:recombination protein RecT
MAVAQKPESTASTALARTDSSPVAVLLLEHRSRLEDLLPDGMRFSRLIAIVRTEVVKNQKILECTPTSVIESIVRIQQWGLEIGVDAYLVPYGKTCTPVADYKGLAKLMVNSRAVRAVQARAVFANEGFRYKYGLDEQLEHHPIHDPKARGAMIGAYCILRLPGGDDVFEFMSIEDIEVIRKQHSKQWGPDKVAVCPPWYAKKTVVRQVSKLVPKSAKFAQVLAVMEEEEEELAEGSDWTVDDNEPAVLDTSAASTPMQPASSQAATAAETSVAGQSAATEEQAKRIGELCNHAAVDPQLAQKTRVRVTAGVTAAFADRIIVGLETAIKNAPPAPVPTEAPLKAHESAAIHDLTLRYQELIKNDRIAPDVQKRVMQRIAATTDLTYSVLEQAVSELEESEIPF